MKQIARPIPLHLHEDVGRELEKLIKTGNLEKVKHVDEDCFVSPLVFTVKNDKSVKIALDSRKLSNSCKKIQPPIPNMEELLNQISVETTGVQTKELIILKIDLDDAYDTKSISQESNQKKVKTILDLNHPENQKQLKAFLGAKLNLAEFLPRLSEKTGKLRKLQKRLGM